MLKIDPEGKLKKTNELRIKTVKPPADNIDALLNEYSEVFQGIECFRDKNTGEQIEVKLEMNPEAISVAQKPRPVPYYLQKPLKWLEDGVKEEIFEKVPNGEPITHTWDWEFPVDDQEVRDRDSEAKEKGKLYADEKRCARECDVKEGDMVLLKQERQNKLTLTFRPEPFHVLDKIGNSVIVETPDGVQYRRNSTHVKKFLERNSLPESQPPVFVTDPGSEAPLPADEDDEPLGQTSMQPVIENTAGPSPSETALHRPTRTRTLPARFKDFVMS